MSLNVILPMESEVLHTPIVDANEFLARLEAPTSQREVIFFDESLLGYVIYNGDRTGDFSVYLDVSIVPSEASKPKFNLDVSQGNQEPSALSSPDPGSASQQPNSYSILNTSLDGNDIVYSGARKFSELHGSAAKEAKANAGADPSCCIIWRFNVPIVYSRKKLGNPRVKVSCYLNEKDSASSLVDLEGLGEEIPLTATDSATLPDYLYADKPNILQELNHGVVQKSEVVAYQKFEFYDEKDRPGHVNHSRTSTSVALDRVEESDVVDVVPSGKVPSQPVHELPIHISGLVSLPIIVSLVIKLKSTKAAGRNNILLSTLNIEASDELQRMYNLNDGLFFDILDLSVVFKAGTIEELASSAFPIRFKLDDSFCLTYKLINNDFLDKELKQLDNSSAQFMATKAVNVKLTLQVQKRLPGSDKFTPMSNHIVTSWNPYLDFSIIAPPINSSLKTTAGQVAPGGYLGSVPALGNSGALHTSPLMQSQPSFGPRMAPRKAALLSVHKQTTASFTDMSIIPSMNNNAPSSNISYSSHTGVGGGPKVLTSASSVTVNLTTSSSILSGLKLTFIGKLSIPLGKITTWRLQAINSSNANINLSLLVQSPSSQHGNANTTNARAISTSNLLIDNKLETPVTYSVGQLQSLYRSLKVAKSGVIILDNDIRLGPLENNSVFETEIKLIGVSRGVFNLDGIKIFDTNTGDGLDFGKLVEVFVV